METLDNPKEELLYQCLDCRGNWGDDDVEIFESNGIKKYICKECRGKCLPKNTLDKKTGVKSIKQRFRKRNFALYAFIGIFSYLTYFSYQSLATISDYKTYLAENAVLRKKINSQLVNFKKDHLILKDKMSEDNDIKSAEKRISNAKRFILSLNSDVEKISKPEKQEIQELYSLEKKFWTNPNYDNYLAYSSVFNDLKRKYGFELFENVKDSLRKKLEHIQKKKIASLNK